MKLGLNTHGFTIIEVMIVLAVSAGLIVAALMYISGEQDKAQFNQSTRDIQTQINDVINNVASGYYSKKGANFKCVASVTGPQITLGANNRGTNKDCIFVGRIIQFAVDDGGLPPNRNPNTGYNVYNLVGLQLDASGQQVTDITAAKPVALTYTSLNPAAVQAGIDTTDKNTTEYGLQARTMTYTDLANATHPVGQVAFISSLGSYAGCTGLCSGSTSIGLWAVDTSSLNQKSDDAVGLIDATANLQQAKSVDICFDSGGGSTKNAVVTIGSNNRQVSTYLTIKDGACT